MRSTLLLSLGSSLLLPATLLSAAQPLPERRPNILLFLVDDMGWQDTSVPFGGDTTALNRRYHTPAMERLARRGVRFTDAYAAPVSSPSRCSLLTGAHAARHRVTNWTLRYDTPSDQADSTLQAPEWNVNGLSPRPDTPHTYYARMLPELLRAAGYHTIHCGKALLARPQPTRCSWASRSTSRGTQQGGPPPSSGGHATDTTRWASPSP